MFQMPSVSLLNEARRLAERGQRVSVLWQKADSLVFIARGREYRSEFHINPSDETMYMIKGEMNLHYRTPDGKEEVAVISEGSLIYTPAGTHTLRFPPDAFALISERNGDAKAKSIVFTGTAANAILFCTKRASLCAITLRIPSPRHINASSATRIFEPVRNAAMSCLRLTAVPAQRTQIKNLGVAELPPALAVWH